MVRGVHATSDVLKFRKKWDRLRLFTIRIGGLRAPSEVLLLKWSDIKWDEGGFIVFSPKTERYKGKEKRFVPLFPALREILEKHPERGNSESEFVINRYRRPDQNLGTEFARIAKRAGLEKIPRPFDNMRASRAMEIDAEFGAFYESKWLGHSQRVADKCYKHSRSADFQRAIGDQTGIRNPEEKPETENPKDDQKDSDCPPIL